jgi:putative transposase
MGRDPRPLEPGTTYHVMARGNDRRPVFLSDDDHEDFVGRLGHVVFRYEWHCLAYCLMGNHFHLAVTTPQGNLSDGMRDLLAGFARTSNLRNGRSGHLFGRRYTSVVVEGDRQLIATLGYILNNPVRAKLTQRPEQWRWSNCAALLGLVPSVRFSSDAETLRLFDSNVASARRLLIELMGYYRDGEGLPDTQVEAAAWLVETDDVGQRLRPSLTEIFDDAPPNAATEAALAAGYRQGEVADFLGISASAVSHRRRYRARSA